MLCKVVHVKSEFGVDGLGPGTQLIVNGGF